MLSDLVFPFMEMGSFGAYSDQRETPGDIWNTLEQWYLGLINNRYTRGLTAVPSTSEKYGEDRLILKD